VERHVFFDSPCLSSTNALLHSSPIGLDAHLHRCM